MVIQEPIKRINYPEALGRRNLPRGYLESVGVSNLPWIEVRERPIAELPIALIRGEVPVHLAQRLRGQLTKYPIIPFLERPHLLLDAIKGREPIVPRVKLLGALGITDPSQERPIIETVKEILSRPPKKAPKKAELSVQI